jgi:heme/copper-type cytochrome/quinol oxidase subunit 1
VNTIQGRECIDWLSVIGFQLTALLRAVNYSARQTIWYVYKPLDLFAAPSVLG